jgi:hypothetical protein
MGESLLPRFKAVDCAAWLPRLGVGLVEAPHLVESPSGHLRAKLGERLRRYPLGSRPVDWRASAGAPLAPLLIWLFCRLLIER